jgi:hypothetical protein
VEADSFIAHTQLGTLDMQNSIAVDTQGVINIQGTVLGECNMVNDGTGMPGSTYFIDTPLFMNKAIGDYRQQAASPGVDMCLDDYFAFSSNRDLGYQLRPVNEATNPSGMPGEAGGKFDGGFWESYINVTADTFDLNLTMDGDGASIAQVISSNVLGIECPADSARRTNVRISDCCRSAGQRPGYGALVGRAC